MDYMDEAVVVYWILLGAIFILVFLSFLEKTKRYKCCGGRPGIVMPLSFLDGYENRAGYVLCFGVCMTSIFGLFLLDTEDQDIKVPGWAKVLYYQLCAILVGLQCYPFFVCLTSSTRRCGVLLSMAYISLSFGIYVAATVERFKKTDISFKEGFCHDPVQCFMILEDVSLSLIVFIFLAYCFVMMLKGGRQLVIPGTARPHQVEYVRWLFRKNKDPKYKKLLNKNKTFIDCMKSRRRLRLLASFPFFKYSTRISTMAGLQFFSVFGASLFVAFMIVILISGAEDVRGEIRDFLHQNLMSNKSFTVMTMVNYVLWFVLGATAVYCISSIFFTLRNYRYNMLKIFQGKLNYQLNEPPQNTLTANLRCIGYTIGFTIWGFLITYILFLLLATIPPGVIILLYQYDLLMDYGINMASVTVITIVITYLQQLFTRVFLLQGKIRGEDKYPPLNVNNRKIYEITHYFFLFLNLAVGLMACFKRVLLSALFGAVSIGRLDRSSLSRHHEKRDSGYLTFISMLVVDNAHNNPTMRVFAHLLWTKVLIHRQHTSDRKKSRVDTLNSSMNINMKDMTPIEGRTKLHRRRALNRWYLAYTLIYNPELQKRIIDPSLIPRQRTA